MAKRQHSRPRPRRGHRRVKKRLPAYSVQFVTEGATEKQYLSLLQQSRYDHRLVLKKASSGSKTSLRNLIDVARRLRKKEPESHVWILCDTDENLVHRGSLEAWLKESDHHHVALTHPSIEYWILEHICDAGSPQSASEAEDALRKQLPDYRKGAPVSSSIGNGVHNACERERQRWKSQGKPDLWSGDAGTTCHRMIEFLDELAEEHKQEEKQRRQG